MKIIITTFLIIFLVENVHSQWIQTNGPEGGAVSALAASGGTMYAAVNYSIYKSVNSGNTWNICFNNGPSYYYYFSGLAIQGLNIYAVGQHGVWLSKDNGNSWQQANNGLTNLDVRCIVTAGANTYIGTNGDGIFLSNDTAQTWNPVDSGIPTHKIFSLINSGIELFAGTDSGVFRTSINNIVWSASNNGLNFHSDIVAMAVSGSYIFAGCGTGPGPYVSSDNGQSWSLVYTGLNNIYINSLMSNGGNVYAGTFKGLFQYNFAGNSWTRIDTNWVCTLTISLLVSGGTIFAGTNAGGIYSSSNMGMSWHRANNGLKSGYVNTLKIKGNEIFAGTYGNGIMSSNDNGNNWNYLTNKLMGPVMGIDFLDSTIISACHFYTFSGEGEGIFISTDHGNNWDTVYSNYMNCVLNDSGYIYAGTNSGLFISTDTFDTWTSINNQLGNLNIQTLKRLGNKIFAGTMSGVYISVDTGASWAPSGLSGLSIGCFLFDNSVLYAGTASGVYLSLDSGNTWIQKSMFSADALVFYDSNLVACNYGGVLFSPDTGTTWISNNTGLTNTWVTCLAVKDNYLFAGTNGDGVFRFSDIPTDISQMDSNFDCKVFPNPAKNYFSISLDQPSDLQIKIYNLSGDLIYSNKFSSIMNVRPDIPLSTGTYVISIKKNDKMIIKKIIIEK